MRAAAAAEPDQASAAVQDFAAPVSNLMTSERAHRGTAFRMNSGKTHRQIYTATRRWSSLLWAVLLCGLLPYALIRLLRCLLVQCMPVSLAALASLMAGLPMLFVGGFVCFTILPFVMVRRMRPQLLAKVQAVYGEDPVDAPMVGFSPGSEVRIYSGDTSSDFGLLVLRTGRMTYLGDTLAFSLAPHQIENVTLIEQSYWGMRIPRLLVAWRERPDLPVQAFTLEAWDSCSLWSSRTAVQDLLERIELWRGAALPIG